ncbi:MAG: HEPN domain-containing protein [Deltaproteobacteria bacterium]|jgi:hypothetical protein|nr:MAG: HEPN domain-containing protein [Deltaproteobacteria bacterium]
MKDETPAWLSYADENLDVAELSLANNHLNACLHNAQQAVEKYLKALVIEYDLPFRKTHAVYAIPIPSFQCLAGCNAGSGDMRKVCPYRSPCQGECAIGIKGQGGEGR